MKKIFLFLLAFLLASCSAVTPTPVHTPSTEDINTEEAAVYTALFQSIYPGSNLVLKDTTSTDPGGADNTASTLAYVLKSMTGVDAGTADSFRARNDAAYPLRPDMELGLQYALLSDTDMRAIFDVNQDGWGMFYSRYPDTPGITSVSRVGFNEAMDQAMVYYGTQSYWLAGAGYIVLLNKLDGKWVIDQQVMTWIS